MALSARPVHTVTREGIFTAYSRWFNGIATLPAGILLFVFAIWFAYNQIIALRPELILTGFVTFGASVETILLACLAAVIPLSWLRREYREPSDILVFQLYLYVYVPSAIYITFTLPMPVGRQFSFHLAMLASLAMLEIRRLIPAMKIPRFHASQTQFYWLVATMGILALLYLIFSGEFEVANLDFSSIYERRGEMVDAGSGTLVFYVANWSALALAPLCLFVGLTEPRWRGLAALGLMIAVVAFGATSFRGNLFTPMFALLIVMALRFGGLRNFAAVLLTVAFALCAIPIVLDVVTGSLTSWLIQFRFIGNNGFLSAQYFDFFTGMPKGYYQDGIGRFFVDPQYSMPIAEVVGSAFSFLGNHANANLWADGYGNLGFGGMAFASACAVIVCWLLDSLGGNEPPLEVAAMTIPLTFAMSNTSVIAALTSNGGLLIFVVLLLMPERQAPRLRF